MTKSEQSQAEKQFREDPNIRYMVVINMCGTGWDFPGLNSVIDLTFTKNPMLIIHRLSRSIRTAPKKPTSTYVYCADQSKTPETVVYYICRALELMTERGILSYDGKVWAQFLTVAKNQKSVRRISLRAYHDYTDSIKVKNRTILRKSLKNIQAMTKLNLVDITLQPFVTYWINQSRDVSRLLTALKTLCYTCTDDVIYTGKALAYLKRHYRKDFEKVYG